MKAAEPGRPYLLYLPGSAGWTGVDDRFVDELRKGDPTLQVEVDDWTGLRKGAGALMDLDANRAEARRIAAKLVARSRQLGRAPCDVMGHSAGTGIAVFALEALPADVRVRNVVLMSSALSEGYDLSKALEHVEGKLYVTVSPGDEMLPFTHAVGTVDRRFGVSAGEAGFTRKGMIGAEKIVVLRTRRGHIGMLGPGFARETVGPLLRE